VLPEWLQNLINGATSTTVTGGSLAVFSYFLLTAGKIYTKGQYESRISEIVTLKNESRQIVVDQLTQALTDKATLQNALNIERAAKDAIASKVMDEIVPLVQVTNKHLDGIEELAKGGDPST
jgi:hypothetical protein